MMSISRLHRDTMLVELARLARSTNGTDIDQSPRSETVSHLLGDVETRNFEDEGLCEDV
jgi:hypothetical protein